MRPPNRAGAARRRSPARASSLATITPEGFRRARSALADAAWRSKLESHERGSGGGPLLDTFLAADHEAARIDKGGQ